MNVKLLTKRLFFKTGSAFFLICFCFVNLLLAEYPEKLKPKKISPVVKIDLLGGQLFFEGKNTSFTGNGNWLLSAGLKYSDTLSIVPVVQGKYRRMREVQELIGGGFLTKQTLDNSVAVRAVYNLNSDWNAKLKGNFKNQMLVESKEEDLGKGLFDNNKIGFGIELEKTGRGLLRSMRFSFDPYGIRFLRYKTLSSGTKFGKEIKSGENILDYNAYDTSIGADVIMLRRVKVSGSQLISYRAYMEQNIVTSSGKYEEKTRKDLFSLTSLGASYYLKPFKFKNIDIQTVPGLDFSYGFQDSNQHNYDASRLKFNKDYYDYSEYTITPKVNAKFWRKLDLSFSYGYTKRNYGNRVIQAKDGTYKKETLHQNNHTINYSLSYPIMYGISAQVQGIYRKTTSNMEYEKTYLYTYDSQHYYLGFTWQYY